MSQIITVTFAEGQREAIAAQPLEQWAYGQTLQFEGLDLPQAYRVDFSNFEYCGASIPRVGGPDGVAVPVEVLTSGRNVYAFIWVQDETSGARYRRATVRVVPGPEPDTGESPEEQSAVTEAINALNAATRDVTDQIDAALQEAKDSGEFDGAPGPAGPAGPAGSAGPAGPAGVGVPAGGTAGQVLAKASGTDFDTEWVDQSGGGGSVEEIFWATYNETAYTEISNAFNAGKIVFVKLPAQLDNVVLPLSYISAESAMFCGVSGNNGSYVYSAECFSDADTWSMGRGLFSSFAPIQSVNGMTGNVAISYDDVGAVAANQGSGNAGKFLVVGSDGAVAPVAMSAWQGGSY